VLNQNRGGSVKNMKWEWTISMMAFKTKLAEERKWERVEGVKQETIKRKN